MIITFVGHRTLCKENGLQERVKMSLIESIRLGEKTIFYCGGYGDFDNLCATVCHSIKKICTDCEIVFVTPYISISQQKKIKRLIEEKTYDSVIYPPLETVPQRLAICKRNEWMIEQADLILAYVDCNYGGAYKALQYATKKGKRIINLANYN